MTSRKRVLESVICPSCGSRIAETSVHGNPSVAASYDDCLRTCVCGQVGASNTSNPLNVTYIYREPLNAIPVESRAGAETALNNALNERNRVSKRTRFGFFPTSEDAVTWVVFTYLLRSKQLLPKLRAANVITDEQATADPTLLLWGVPIDSDGTGNAIRERLRELCLSLGEQSRSLSEPDVMIDLGEKGLVIIEVKHRSGNDKKAADYAGWQRYLDAPHVKWSGTDVQATGLYELARNWCLLTGLSGGRRVTLVNLAPQRLFDRAPGRKLEDFRLAIREDEARHFVTLSWCSLLDAILPDVPTWLAEFCTRWGVGGAAQGKRKR